MINNIRQEILESLAQVEVNIDYPEYDDVETMTSQMLLEKRLILNSFWKIFYQQLNAEKF